MRKVREKLRLILVILAFGALVIAGLGSILLTRSEQALGSDTATVRIGSDTVPPGGSTTVPLEVLGAPAPGVSAVKVDIVYNPSVVDPTDWSPGPDFDMVLCGLDYTPNTVRCTALSATGVPGDSLLANITFQCIGGAGQCSALDVSVVIFTDPDGNPIPVSDEDGQICCGEGEPNAMAVDAVSGDGIDASRTAMLDVLFDVDIVVTDAPIAYMAEQYTLQWDPAVLAYDDETPTFLDGLTLCGLAYVTANTVYNGCGATAPTTATGAVHTVTLHCVEEGTSPLHLVSLDEDPEFGTTTALTAGVMIDTALIDASVTCSACVFSDDADCDACWDSVEPTLDPPATSACPWDFYDVPVPTLFSGGHISGDPSGTDDRDHAISIVNDLLAVLEYCGCRDGGLPNAGGRQYNQDINGDGVDDGIAYDRSVPPAGPCPQRSAEPDGAISIVEDLLLVLAQSGQSCGSTPP